MLNSLQKQAVQHGKGPLQVIAGPGTGKTRVLTERVDFLLEKHDPANIIVTTFTKKAAYELVERLKSNGRSQDVLEKLLIGTFHSICVRILRRFGSKIGLKSFQIADNSDINQILKSISGQKAVDMLKNEFSNCKNRNMVPEKPLVRELFTKYNSKMASLNLLDFDDLLLKTNDLLQQFPDVLGHIEHVLVDEFQDTSKIQLELCYKFCGKNNNLTVVGDPNQAIYGFRAAESDVFEKMKAHYPQTTVVELLTNYRSSAGVIASCAAILGTTAGTSAVKSDKKTSFYHVYRSLEEEEAFGVAEMVKSTMRTENLHWKDFAILLRVAHQSTPFERELRKAGIPYRMRRGQSFWSRPEIAVVVAYLRVVFNDNDVLAMVRTLNVPSRGVGAQSESRLAEALEASPGVDSLRSICESCSVKVSKKAATNLKEYCDKIEDIRKKSTNIETVFDAVVQHFGLEQQFGPQNWPNVQQLRQELLMEPKESLMEVLESVLLDAPAAEQNDAVTISTIHSAKGLEWPVVFVPSLVDDVFPHKKAVLQGQEQEERRVLYVAATRAKTSLYLSSFECAAGASRFVRNLEAESKKRKLDNDEEKGFRSAKLMVGSFGSSSRKTTGYGGFVSAKMVLKKEGKK